MTTDCDILIYGGTAAGVIAAITAATQSQGSQRVLLIEPGRHLGGMTTGGLGWTDFGKRAAIGGRSRSFYIRVGDHYEKTLGTRQFTEQGAGGGGGDDGACYVFEPSVAEMVIEQMLAEAGDKVRVIRNHRLTGVEMRGGRIDVARFEHVLAGRFNEPGDGPVQGKLDVRPRICIDCTYEGDLMAAAGVSYHVGREANSQYGETHNGIPAETRKHQISVPVDPYVRPGDPDSGVIPLVANESLGTPGSGDKSVQAYNFRLCLTDRDDIRIPLAQTPPPDHDPARYEVLRRYVISAHENGETRARNHLKIDPMPNGKTDINNQGGVSTDHIGMNHAYPEAGYAERGRIWRDHVNYVWGLVHYLATAEDIPANVRQEVASLGLCRDEFIDTHHWPHQLYVREARRMVSDLVMTDHHCFGRELVDDPIGLAAYTMDSHNCRRIIQDGLVKNEGDVQVPPTDPYPVGYQAIVPRRGEAENLLVPVCLSASHIAFGSIRMEPVFMVLGESAALAALLAIEGETSVQDVAYDRLRPLLEEAKQVLAWEG